MRDMTKALWKAVKKGDWHRIQSLAQQGANIHAVDHNGWNLLHHACFYVENQKNEIEWLLNQHINVNAITIDGQTALHLACIADSYAEVLDLLIERGADYTLKNGYGKTPLDLTMDLPADMERHLRQAIVQHEQRHLHNMSNHFNDNVTNNKKPQQHRL